MKRNALINLSHLAMICLDTLSLPWVASFAIFITVLVRFSPCISCIPTPLF